MHSYPQYMYSYNEFSAGAYLHAYGFKFYLGGVCQRWFFTFKVWMRETILCSNHIYHTPIPYFPYHSRWGILSHCASDKYMDVFLYSGKWYSRYTCMEKLVKKKKLYKSTISVCT